MSNIITYLSSFSLEQYTYFIVWGMLTLTIIQVCDLTRDHWDEDTKIMALCCHIVLGTSFPLYMLRNAFVEVTFFLAPRIILGAMVYRNLTIYDFYAFICLSVCHALYAMLPWIMGYTEYREHPEAYKL